MKKVYGLSADKVSSTKRLMSGLTLIAALLPVSLYAQTVPSEISSLEMLKGYKDYLKQSKHKAFYLSDTGHWGASWNYSNPEDAKAGALKNCQGRATDYQCKIVDLNGKVQTTQTQYSTLQKSLVKAKKTQWPIPTNKIPSVLKGFPKTLKSYKKYQKRSGHKAFAFAENSGWGSSFGASTDKAAQYTAMANCKKYSKDSSSCRLIDINNQIIGDSVEEIPSINKVDISLVKEIPVSIKTTYQLEDYLTFLALPLNNRAFAVKDPFYASSGFAFNQTNIEEAKSEALKHCDRQRPEECRVVAINDEVLEKTISTDTLTQAPSKISTQLPNPIKDALKKVWRAYSRSAPNNGHRAIVMSNLRVKGVALDYITPEYAVEGAMQYCEDLLEAWKIKDQKCRVLMINDSLNQETVTYLLEMSQ